MKNLASRLKILPDKPGIYFFRGCDRKIIYVGKAKSLRKRVRSYFTKTPNDTKVISIRQNMADFDYIVTSSELEAVMLESNYIKKYRPRYNIILRDDKQYPYLKLTINEEWPKLLLVRKLEDDGAKYFGPYTSSMVKETMRLLKRLFPIRWCRQSPLKKRKQPCMYYYIRRCSAPCIGAIDRKSYMEMAQEIVQLLRGRFRGLLRRLKKDMGEASLALDFERAKIQRDRIRSLEKIMNGQAVVSVDTADRDVIAYSRRESFICAVVLKVREGKLVGRDIFYPEGASDSGEGEMFSSMVSQYYADCAYIPPEIVLGAPVDEKGLLSKFLSKKRGAQVRLVHPTKGRGLALVKMAKENAGLLLERKVIFGGGEREPALLELKIKLRLEALPLRIEAFDISNIQGEDTVGSMVTFVGGKPHKSDYRKFKVLGRATPDDVGCMYEIVKRRYSGSLKGELGPPDLVLVDGGIGQVNAAHRALEESSLSNIPVLGLAKKLEVIYLFGKKSPVRLPRDTSSLHLLQRIRDEAHRFAITFHRAKRARRLR